jgi:D-3-phosphoglycerate dehydrogenase
MAAVQLDDYLRYGNIKNSVNFPNVSLPVTGDTRICVLHENIPAVISQVTTVVSDCGANIENMINKSKGNNAYTLFDVTGALAANAAEKISAVTGVVKVRII